MTTTRPSVFSRALRRFHDAAAETGRRRAARALHVTNPELAARLFDKR